MEDDTNLDQSPDNAYFHEQLVEVAMGIIVDCKKVVETVNGINTTEDDPLDSESRKDNFVQAVKRVPQTSTVLIEMIKKFVSDNKSFYVADKDYLDLFRLLEQGSRNVKDSVLNLVRLATVSAFRTKSVQSTMRSQTMLEQHCKNVALSIKKVMDAAEELKNLEEDEEEEWIKSEADELAKLITNKNIFLAKQSSTKVKELIEAAAGDNGELFVTVAKETSTQLTKLRNFASTLGIKEESDLREATYNLVLGAKQAFTTKSQGDFSQLEGRKNAVAQAIRGIVLAASALDTEEIVRARLQDEISAGNPQVSSNGKKEGSGNGNNNLAVPPSKGSMISPDRAKLSPVLPKNNSSPELVSSTKETSPSTVAGTPSPSPSPPSSLDPNKPKPNATTNVIATTTPATPTKKTIKLTKEQLEQLRNHLQQKKYSAGKAAGRAPRAHHRATMRAQQQKAKENETDVVNGSSQFDLSRFNNEKTLAVVIKLQRRVKRWYRIHRFRTIALDYYVSPESERLRKRNLAMREILSTERTYVNQLEDLDRSIIQPLKAQTHSFITEAQIDTLFSNLESILCLNLQLLENMEERMEDWPSNGHFADIFIKKAPVLRLYTEYINSYDRQVDLLMELESKKPQFKDWCKVQNPKISLVNYLILPVQRIPRYEMLLGNLLKYTQDYHVDYINIKSALDTVQELNLRAEKKKTDEDNRKKIMEIQSKLSGGPALLVAHRMFIREGALAVSFTNKKGKEENLYGILFSDILLLTKPSTKKRKLRHTIHFKDRCSVEKASDVPNAFRIVDQMNQKTFLVTAEAKWNEWIKDIEEVVKEQAWKKILY